MVAPQSAVRSPQSAVRSPTPPDSRLPPSMELPFRWFGPADPIPLAHIRQIPGATGVVSALYDVPVGEAWRREPLGGFQGQIEHTALPFPPVGRLTAQQNTNLGRRGRRPRIANFS